MDKVGEERLEEFGARLDRLETEHNRSPVRAVPDRGGGLIRVREYSDLPTDYQLGTYGYVTGDKDARGWFAEAGTLPPEDVGYYRFEQVRDMWDGGDNTDPALDTFKNEWMPLNTPLYVRVTEVKLDILVCVWVNPVTYVPFLPPDGPQITVAKPYHLRRMWFDRVERPQVPLLGLAAEVNYHEPLPTDGPLYEFEVADRSRNAWEAPSSGDAEVQQISPDYATDEVLSIVRLRQRIPAFFWPADGGPPVNTFARWEDVNTAGRCWAAVPAGS